MRLPLLSNRGIESKTRPLDSPSQVMGARPVWGNGLLGGQQFDDIGGGVIQRRLDVLLA
jgi:hypothetical protein